MNTSDPWDTCQSQSRRHHQPPEEQMNLLQRVSHEHILFWSLAERIHEQHTMHSIISTTNVVFSCMKIIHDNFGKVPSLTSTFTAYISKNHDYNGIIKEIRSPTITIKNFIYIISILCNISTIIILSIIVISVVAIIFEQLSKIIHNNQGPLH